MELDSHRFVLIYYLKLRNLYCMQSLFTKIEHINDNFGYEIQNFVLFSSIHPLLLSRIIVSSKKIVCSFIHSNIYGVHNTLLMVNFLLYHLLCSLRGLSCRYCSFLALSQNTAHRSRVRTRSGMKVVSSIVILVFTVQTVNQSCMTLISHVSRGVNTIALSLLK